MSNPQIDKVWNQFYGGQYTLCSNESLQHKSGKIVFHESVFSGFTTGALELSGTVRVLLLDSSFSHCSNSKNGGSISSSCLGLVLFRVCASECKVYNSQWGGFIWSQPNSHSSLEIHNSGLTQCGDPKGTGVGQIYVNGGQMNMKTVNVSHCKALGYAVMETDFTNHGATISNCIFTKNIADSTILGLEEPLNRMVNTLIINNGNEKMTNLLYASVCTNYYDGCVFMGNIGSGIFSAIYQTSAIIYFISCTIQSAYGGKTVSIASGYQENVVFTDENILLEVQVCNFEAYQAEIQ